MYQTEGKEYNKINEQEVGGNTNPDLPGYPRPSACGRSRLRLAARPQPIVAVLRLRRGAQVSSVGCCNGGRLRSQRRRALRVAPIREGAGTRPHSRGWPWTLILKRTGTLILKQQRQGGRPPIIFFVMVSIYKNNS